MSLDFLFNVKSSIVVIGCFILLTTASCSQSKYKVYDQELNSLKIQLKNKDKVFILKDFTTCIDCLREVVSFYTDKKEVILISVVSKSISAIVREKKEINRLINDSVQVYFQFSKKKNPYRYRVSNRIFEKYSNRRTSPIIIIVNSEGEITRFNYQEFLQNVD